MSNRTAAGDYPFFDTGFLAFAHRGGAHYPPNRDQENSLAAFQNAVDLGYRYLETDVHATRDGELVAFHDDRLDRVTDRTGAVAELTFDEVRRARIGGRHPIPTLAELLDAFPEARFNIDAKAPGAVQPLADLVRTLRATDRVCISSFDTGRLRQLRRLLPEVPSAVSVRAVQQLRFLPGLARLPLLRQIIDSAGVALQIPVSRTVLGRRIEVVTPGLIDIAHRTGRQVHVWTIDEAAEMERLLDLGVDGIFTDRIDVLKDVLIERGRWR